MSTKSVAGKFAQWVMVPVLVAAVGVAVAQGQQGQDNHRDQRNDNHHGNQRDQGNNFRFRDQDRGNFQSHYRNDVNRWRSHPQGRPHFARGQRIPSGYRFQPVPRAYYANVPPPPPGYQYGYYDGYVVSYNPTTQIIADVMDLVAGAANSR
jgi:Ni/Co efflux regulator RcnB